jgi:ATP-dependent Clp protease ATP-binding subunit ClpA
MTKVNCAEFQSDHEIAKLIGSPPGYLGHRETKPVLMQDAISAYEAKDPKVNLVLFDEIEKASPSLWNLLLGIMDKATLTLGDGKTTSFSNSIIFLTSNLGAKEMDSCLTQIGFSPHQRPDHGTEYNNRTRKIGVGAARKRFSPEFFNRLDHVIVFRPLSEKELILILELELQALQEQLRAGKSPILVDLS